MRFRFSALLGGLALASLGQAALAQAVVSPDTEPSTRVTGAKTPGHEGAIPGSATVTSRAMSNGKESSRPSGAKAETPTGQ